MIFKSNRKMNKNNLFIIILKFNKIKTKIINILKIKMKVILMNKKMRKFNQSFNNKLKNKIEFRVNNFKKIYNKKYKMMKIPTFE